MITASHNPKEYNGFKFSFSIKGNACGKEIYDFRDFLFNGNFRNAQGFYQEYNDNFESYINKITESIDLGSKKIKAVFDPGNGTGSIILERILKKFDIDYKIINGISDGNFPVHHPDPSVEENMQMLKEEVTNNHFDIALGIDGDADRVGVVDNKAVFTPIDNVMINMYKYLNTQESIESGIILYRNAFSISSYEGKKDWLGLGKRSRKSPAAASHPGCAGLW